jgi:predicted GIY-YIG superfamily endonuclease
MSLEYIQTPTVDIVKVMKALALNARTNPADETILIGPSTIKSKREAMMAIPLKCRLELHGLEADIAQHTEFMRLQGWTHFMSDHGPRWIIRRDTPTWIPALYFLPRCLGCAKTRWFKCRCDQQGRPGRRGPKEYVYILELATPGHFYVGRTVDPELRMQEHAAGYGSDWTSSHKPVLIRALEEVRIQEAAKIENQTTLDVMATFGRLVRGGSYLTFKHALSVWSRTAFLPREMRPPLVPKGPSIWRPSADDLRLAASLRWKYPI